jgi:hypothetical protein
LYPSHVYASSERTEVQGETWLCWGGRGNNARKLKGMWRNEGVRIVGLEGNTKIIRKLSREREF